MEKSQGFPTDRPESLHTSLRSHDLSPSSEPPAYVPQDPSQSTINNNPSQTTNLIIAIPALHSSFDSPFIRAYAPILRQKNNLPRESFLTFLDNLNKVIANSPPLEVLDVTGGILKSVPLLFPIHWLGSAVSGLAKLGSLGVSKSRTDSLIKQANRDIFGPRGLKIEIAKLDALAHIASIPILDSQGKINRNAPVMQRLLKTGIDVPPSPTPQSEERDGDIADAVQQRIKILQPWIAELEFNILPWTAKSKLTRFNAALKKRNEDIRHRDEPQHEQQYTPSQYQQQDQQTLSVEEYNQTIAELDRRERKLRDHNESGDASQALAEIAQERALASEMYARSQQGSGVQIGGQEDGGVKKGLWLVIREV